MLRKGVMYYGYIDSWEKVDEKLLPSEEKLDSELNNEEISDRGYRHAQKVWNKLKIRK